MNNIQAFYEMNKPQNITPTGHDLLLNLSKIHTTELGVLRIKRNLCLDVGDVVAWCIEKIKDRKSIITRKGKNMYIHAGECVITINAHSYTIITAHAKVKEHTAQGK
jgi:hypothetical protein